MSLGSRATDADFTGRTVLLTGAGGQAAHGTGRALATGFAALGARVAAVDMNRERLDETVALIESAGGEAVAVVADLSSAADANRAVDEAEAAFGRVDILINHAGIGNFLSATETDDDMWHRIMAVDLTAPFLLSRRVLPGMVSAGRGVIINTISIAGLTGGRAGAAYTAAKHGLVGLTRNIAVAYAPEGIRCCGVAPGSIRADADMQSPGITEARGDSWAARWGRRTQDFNLRVGTAEEVSRIHLFLASDGAAYINGAIVTVDGGWTAV